MQALQPCFLHSAVPSTSHKIVNDDCGGSNAGKLCTEDPVSVSRQFSSKFHAFFNTIIIKGEVLGTVDHFYWKKEYQTRGAPHYHVLLWIRDAPMIGRDDPSKVLAWIEERITCHIPDQENNPELHNLVTRYQLHKCSNYCKRKRKRGKTFVTMCKFEFPREPSESPKVHCVEEKLKKRQKIYQISRTEAEVRVNDYNPLLLLCFGKPIWTFSLCPNLLWLLLTMSAVMLQKQKGAT